MKHRTTESILSVFFILLFLVSVVRIPVEIGAVNDTVNLSRVIMQVKELSNQVNDVDVNHFQKALHSALQALQVTAGLTTSIAVNSSDKGESDEATIVVCTRIPYLLASGIDCPSEASYSTLSTIDHPMVDTSIYLSPDTPPPIIG